MKENHLLILTNLPAFYKENLYKEISKYRKVSIIFNGVQGEERRADFFVKFKGIETYSLVSKFSIFRLFQLIKLLVHIKFDELLIGGWDTFDLWVASYLTKKKKNSMILESSIFESNIKSYKGVLKSFFLKRIHKVYASGNNQIELLKQLDYEGTIIKTKGVGLINLTIKKDYIKKEKVTKFLYVGRFSEEKNIFFLINYFKNNATLSLSLIGYGRQEKELIEKVKLIDNIHIIGAVNNKDLHNYYQSHDVFLLASAREPWGLVVEEAIYNGIPAIVSDRVGCAYEFLIEGENGFIFKFGNEKDFDNKIKIITNKNVYNKLTKNIHETDFKDLFYKQVSAYI